jgi:hypothetical protein
MQHGDSIREAGCETFNSLLCEGDFRHHDDSPLSKLKASLGSRQVYFSLAGACDALNQKRSRRFIWMIQSGANGIGDGLLLGRKADGRFGIEHLASQRVAVGSLLGNGQPLPLS